MHLTKKILVIATAAIIGFCLGVFYASHFIDIASKVRILYVAEDELMELENARVQNEKLDNRQFFFGRTEEAVSLATSLPKSYQNRKTRVIYSMSSVKGQNVRSISAEIHKQIIAALEKSVNFEQLGDLKGQLLDQDQIRMR